MLLRRKESDKYLSQEIKSFELVAKPMSYERLNDQLARWRCYVVASGRNANRSDIELDAIKKGVSSIYNIPMVANLKKKDDGSGDFCVGSHDQSWEWDEDDNLAITDLTVPFGVVPENCNPIIEDVLEPDGITVNKYLVVDVIAWVGRYNILDAAFSDEIYFNQSCEIMVNKSYQDSDGYQIIQDFTFSALCLLGKSSNPKYNKRPCFPSARVERIKYSLDKDNFKQQFSLLMQEIKKFNEFNLENHNSNLNISGDISENNQKKKEDEKLNKEIKFSDVCEKIRTLMSENTYSSNGKKYEKYHICAIREDSKFVDVVDREDNYSVYKIPYVATQVEEDLLVSLDYDNKIEKSFVIGDKTETVFDINAEVQTLSKDLSDYSVSEYESKEMSELRENLASMTAQFNITNEELTTAKKHLEVYESEKRQLMEKQHRDTIDNLIDSKKDEMGRFSELLEYCLNDHYGKTVDTVKAELKEIHYNFMQKKFSNNKQSFSVIETNVVTGSSEDDSLVARWGEENAKYLK